MTTPALRLKARQTKPTELNGPVVALFVALIVLGLILFIAPPLLLGLLALPALGAPAWGTALGTLALLFAWGWLLSRWAKRTA